MRKAIFWLHLSAGITAGAVIFVMSATGALLTYERQIMAWADGYRVEPASGAPPPSVERLLAAASAARPKGTPTAVTLRSDPTAPAMVALGREALFLDPRTGAVLGEGSARVRAFFRVAEDWHRWLGASGEARAWGRAVTGACNLAFLGIVLGGLLLWWPARWSRASLAQVALFRRGLRGKARDFNWHNVVGLWSFLPLVVMVGTALPMSYPWASDLAFRLVGDEPPRRPAPEGGRPTAPPRDGADRPAPAATDGLDALWARAERQVAGWQSITMRLGGSADAPVAFAIDASASGAVRPDMRSLLILDRRSGEVLRFDSYGSQSPGRRARLWMRFSHTGEAFGLFGQTVAGAAAAGVTVLIGTGWVLAWRRFRGWRARRSARRALVAAAS